MRSDLLEMATSTSASVLSDLQLAFAHRPRPSKHRGARDFDWPISKRGDDRRRARGDHVLKVRAQQRVGLEFRSGPNGSEAAAVKAGRTARKTALAASQTKRLPPAAAPKTEPRR